MDWRQVLRNGLLPQLSDDALAAVRLGLERDDRRLIQGMTCDSDAGKPVAACLFGYAGWIGEGLKTKDQVEAYFATLALTSDHRTGVPFSIRLFANVFDDLPRPVMLSEMLAEVGRETARRAETRSAAVAG